MSPIIQLTLKKCVDNKAGVKCPYCTEKLTKGFGYAVDYMCKLMDNRVTSGYVEWESEINPVPSWCPIRTDKHQQDAERIAKFAGENI